MLRFAERRAAGSMLPGQNYGLSLISPVLSGVVVTPQSALTLTAFFAGVNVISTDVAKLPFGVQRKTRGGGQKPATKDRRHYLLRRQPNPELNAFRYRQMQMGHALGWGNHYSHIARDGSGMPTALWPLHPGTTRAMRDGPGKPLYYQDVNTGKRYPPEDILHIAGLSFDGIMGYGPATLGRQAIGLGIGAEQFGASLFGNGAIPKGMLRTPKKLSEAAARRLRETFELIHGGTLNANRLAVLEEGLEWVETQISPEAAQFLATRQFQVIEVARLLNLPPHKLQDYSESHLANIEESNLDYLNSTLMGWLEAIEAEVNLKLFFEDEHDRLYAEHDVRALMRGNSQARADYYTKLKTGGIVNADTVAAAEGLPIPGPANGGNLYLIQSQNIPAQNAGKPQPKPAGKPSPPSVKTDPDAATEPDPTDPQEADPQEAEEDE